MNRGYIKLWRKTLDSDVWDNPHVFRVWCWCLMKATYKPIIQMVGYQSVPLLPGQFIFGRKKCSSETKVSEKQVRTCLQALKTANRIAIKTASKFSIVSVINWDDYQSQEDTKGQQNGQQKGHEGASKGPAKGHKQEVKEPKNKHIDPDVHEIISYLNQTAGKNFHFNGANAKFVSARLKDGATVEQCKAVIDSKVKEWIGTDYEKYIRPETLFNERKFEGYVNSITRSPNRPSEATSHAPIN